MDSKKINEIIRKMDDENNDSPIYESSIGGKIIPYIGWFWREVDFDNTEVFLGVLPKLKGNSIEGGTDRPLVGFMENDKWGYLSFKVDGDAWMELKRLIVSAISTEEKEDFKKVDDFMQSLIPAGA